MRELAGVDCGRNTGISFTQHYKSILINVVVDEHDGVFGLLDEADDVGVGIKDLSVVEDTLHGWQRRAHEEVNLVFQVYLPSAAVSKDSLRTAESTNSPSLKILPIWRVMLFLVV